MLLIESSEELNLTSTLIKKKNTISHLHTSTVKIFDAFYSNE